MSSREFTEHLAYDSVIVDPMEKIEIYLQQISLQLDRGPVEHKTPPKLEDYKFTFKRVPVVIKKATNSIMGTLTHWATMVNSRYKDKGKFK